MEVIYIKAKKMEEERIKAEKMAEEERIKAEKMAEERIKAEKAAEEEMLNKIVKSSQEDFRASLKKYVIKEETKEQQPLSHEEEVKNKLNEAKSQKRKEYAEKYGKDYIEYEKEAR